MNYRNTGWRKAVCWGVPVLFFVFFFMISRYAPLAGDDWGYAAGGRYNSALMRAWQNYFSWSGRFLSELWGYGIAPHKKLWNVLNAGIFTGIFVMMRDLAGDEKHPLLVPAVLVCMILSVPDQLRMEVYTWIMGSTYAIPLLLFLIYVRLLKEAVFEGRKSTVRTAVCILLNLAVPLYMENAAAMIFGANVLVLLYVLHYDRQKARTMLMYTLVSTIGVCLIRFSPGALARSSRDHAAFAALTLFEKIAVNLPSLMTYTFTAYPWFYGILSVILVLWAQKQKTTVRIPVMVLSVLSLAEIVLPVPEVFSWVFRMIFLCMMFAVSLCLQERGERFFALFILLCGCGANAVMLVSPIFAVRSSVYTIFLFMLWGLYLLERTELPEAASRFLSVVSCAAAMVLVLRYTQLYRMINRINLKRMSQIQYYADRPDITDLWIMGYPENSVHSADVVEGDDFHDAVFKEYYFLNPESTLHFYYLKEYDAESILNG